ncbi:hypothetical protein QQS21_006846 [Conoideocrella luteorostrata]|uniref:Nucleic acid-binding, OB-fold protein n=1 Tax=Conoideocrella luteorostrata TaxID=1105319 RepID=A0AAJ0FSK9_9HYPO|nr:hypothetical protein QQS21_006846 [Conoideocrella luteorostrata]
MAPKRLLFTGPPSSSITEASCSVATFETPFLNLFNLQPSSQTTTAHPLPPPQYAAWRSLPLTRQPLHTGLTQTHMVNQPQLVSHTFFTTADTTMYETGPSQDPASQDILTQFCEQSLAAHNSGCSLSEDSVDTTDSFLTSIHSDKEPPAAPSHLSDLEDIPSAKQVTSLHPQTITLNIIVGVLSVAQPRTVTTRWGTRLSLIEILVGDDTATGFAVTFWVPSDRVAESDVVGLRRQDVVLMENVALHVFRDKVYGQSLRRGLTRLHLLWRADGSGCYSSRGLKVKEDSCPQREKTRIVRDWVVRFVGLDLKGRIARGASSWDRPPDDTQ